MEQKAKVNLFIGDTQGHHSVKKSFGLGYISIDAAPLDEILQELKVEKVKLIKIDVEGEEKEVVEGLVSTIERYRPIIVLEVKEDFAIIKNFMSQLGYKIKQIAQDYYIFTHCKTFVDNF